MRTVSCTIFYSSPSERKRYLSVRSGPMRVVKPRIPGMGGSKTRGLTTRSDSVTCPPIPTPCGPLFARFVDGGLCSGEEVLFRSGSGTGGVSDMIWSFAMVQDTIKNVFRMDCG